MAAHLALLEDEHAAGTLQLVGTNLVQDWGCGVLGAAAGFNPHYQVRKRDRQNLVQHLTAVVADNLPLVGESITLQNQMDAGPIPRCFGDVRIYRSPDLTKHHWSVPEAGYVMEDFQTELQHAIDSKNDRYDQYRLACDSFWLLVVASGREPSTLFAASLDTLTHVYRSRFERTLLLQGIAEKCVVLTTTP